MGKLVAWRLCPPIPLKAQGSLVSGWSRVGLGLASGWSGLGLVWPRVGLVPAAPTFLSGRYRLARKVQPRRTARSDAGSAPLCQTLQLRGSDEYRHPVDVQRGEVRCCFSREWRIQLHKLNMLVEFVLEVSTWRRQRPFPRSHQEVTLY